MASQARKVFGAFEKRAPGLNTTTIFTIFRSATNFTKIAIFFRNSRNFHKFAVLVEPFQPQIWPISTFATSLTKTAIFRNSRNFRKICSPR